LNSQKRGRRKSNKSAESSKINNQVDPAPPELRCRHPGYTCISLYNRREGRVIVGYLPSIFYFIQLNKNKGFNQNER